MTLEQIAADFGVYPMTLSKWRRRSDVEAGVKPGATRSERAETRELRKRVRLLEQENEVVGAPAADSASTELACPAGPNGSVYRSLPVPLARSLTRELAEVHS